MTVLCKLLHISLQHVYAAPMQQLLSNILLCSKELPQHWSANLENTDPKIASVCHLLQFAAFAAICCICCNLLHLLHLQLIRLFEICCLPQWLWHASREVLSKYQHICARRAVIIRFAALLVFCCKNAAFCSKSFIWQLCTHRSVI